MNTMHQEHQDKLIFRIAIGISIVVLIAVIVLNQQVLPKPEVLPSWTYLLPKLNALINGTCSILLMLSLYFIKQKNVQAHKMTNLTAFALSSVFLVSYVLYHWLATSTEYPKDNPSLRLTYLLILVSHIVLAAVVLPLILMSFYRGLQMQVELHKKIVRFAFPIWLYVTVTGVIVYLMISPYYPIETGTIVTDTLSK
jgi:putative membrane protein